MGDPQQLPSFDEQAALFWRETHFSEEQRDEEQARQITTQLTRSVFEQLWSSLVDSRHTIRLKTLQQIPRIIADFVSRHFYEGELTTSDEGDKEATLERTLSAHPMVLVDTAAMPAEQRKESLPGKPKEKEEATNPKNWGQPGYINRGEAKLLADLAVAYQREGHNWMVLVPYPAQATFIYNMLQKRLSIDKNELKERIGTVEAFQDRTADMVLYGFTRSNSDGEVGHLRELRLLNVALTRAHKQVVLVGDLSTLKHANDEALRKLIDALSKYVEQYGELLAYDECQSRVQTGSLAV
jgi:superfamily I DNA and/or RNA helicase